MRRARALFPLICVVVGLFGALSPARAITYFGEVREISTAVASPLIARNDGVNESVITLVDGAEICCGSRVIRMLGTSVFVMEGGLVGGEIWGYDQTQLRFDGGDVRGSIWSYDDATVLVEDGEIGLGIYARYASDVEIRKGRIRGPVRSHEDSNIEVAGGSLGELAAFHRSRIVMHGGTVLEGSVDAADEAAIDLTGSDFEVDGVPVGFGPIAAARGLLTGRLQSGAWFERPFRHADADNRSGTITLVEATPAVTELNDDLLTTVNDETFADVALLVTGASGLNLDDSGSTIGVYLEDDASLGLIGGSSDGSVVASNRSTALLQDGVVGGGVYGRDEASVTVQGSSIMGALHAQGDSQIEVVGFDFAVDGVPVAAGPLAQSTGVLTGEIGFSDQFDGRFFHAGYDERATGQISLSWNPLRTTTLASDTVINNIIFSSLTGIATGNALIQIVGGGSIARLAAEDDSVTMLVGGDVNNNLVTSDSATVMVLDGMVGGDIASYGSSRVTMQGGDLGGQIYARGDSLIEIVGANFEVGQVPTALGSLGLKNGTLYVEYPNAPDPDDWEVVELDFSQGGFGGANTGSVVLKLDDSVSTVFGTGTTTVSNGANLTARSVVAGEATLEIDPGGLFLDVYVQEDAHLHMRGGRLDEDLVFGESATGMIEKGKIKGALAVYGNAAVVVVGGDLEGSVYSQGENAEIVFQGTNFTVNPGGTGRVPAPYGLLEAKSGELRGDLASGDALEVFFFRGAFGDDERGSIRLPEPSSSVLGLAALVVLAGLACRPHRQRAMLPTRRG